MNRSKLVIKPSGPLEGEIAVDGAKNAVLVIMASLLLTRGKSRLWNVPASADVLNMCALLESLGAQIQFDTQLHLLEVDTDHVQGWHIDRSIMKKMRASVLVMGPLLGRFGKAQIALPGGCIIGARPIDYHLKNFKKMGVVVREDADGLIASCTQIVPARLVLEYPSVGATENSIMAAVLAPGKTVIVNAAVEPEVVDLIAVLQKMGARIQVTAPATITIQGVEELKSIEHTIVADRLEAGVLLLAGAITTGKVCIPEFPASLLDVFLLKLQEMGHAVTTGMDGLGVTVTGAAQPQAISFKTGPFPGFPTDLQAPTMAATCLADGNSVIEETVFENRLVHARELMKMGAQVTVKGSRAVVTGVDALFAAAVIASDIRASCALVLAGLVAQGQTVMTGVHHWRRGYEALEKKLNALGADIQVEDESGYTGVQAEKRTGSVERVDVL